MNREVNGSSVVTAVSHLGGTSGGGWTLPFAFWVYVSCSNVYRDSTFFSMNDLKSSRITVHSNSGAVNSGLSDKENFTRVSPLQT